MHLHHHFPPAAALVQRRERAAEIGLSLRQLRQERDALIRSSTDLGVRELGRLLGMSGAQVSRIRNRP